MQTDLETSDAKKVDQALTLLQEKNINEAEAILRDVCSRCPDDYEFEFTSDGARYMKFWAAMEFMEYIASIKENKRNVVWLPSAYPRACFNLAYILVDKRDLNGAVHWLKRGQSMEPRNPNFLLEMGVVYAHMKESQKSFGCYQRAIALTILSKQKRAVALRGMGVQLIDLQRLDEAEEYLKEAVELEPDNSSAKQELLYISQLRSSKRAGGKKKSWFKFWMN